jgi:putative oxidoreductase
MKYVVLTCRILMGVLFLFFGANMILNFLRGPLPPGDAGAWSALMMSHHYMTFVGLVMEIAGLLLLVGRFVPLALAMLAPVLVNILLFHFLFYPRGVIVPIVLSVIEVFLMFTYRRNFLPLLEADARPESPAKI